MERLREANAAIIEFEQLIAEREAELKVARQEICELRERLESARLQTALEETAAPAQSADSMAITGEQLLARREALRIALEQILRSGQEFLQQEREHLPETVCAHLEVLLRRSEALLDLLG